MTQRGVRCGVTEPGDVDGSDQVVLVSSLQSRHHLLQLLLVSVRLRPPPSPPLSTGERGEASMNLTRLIGRSDDKAEDKPGIGFDQEIR